MHFGNHIPAINPTCSKRELVIGDIEPGYSGAIPLVTLEIKKTKTCFAKGWIEGKIRHKAGDDADPFDAKRTDSKNLAVAADPNAIKPHSGRAQDGLVIGHYFILTTKACH